ncbi:MAG: hypothetical protein ACREOB_06795, partial [Thermodesulfobacteriota bacterium]
SERFKNWAEIRKALEADDLPVTKNTPFVEILVNKSLERDRELKEQALKQEKRIEEMKEQKGIVRYQFEKSILIPFKELIDEFNSKYQGEKISISEQEFDQTAFIIQLPSGRRIYVEVKILFDEDFYREEIKEGFGRRIVTKQLRRPLLYERKIMAWGEVRGGDGKGFNLVLVEQQNGIYGDWFILVNTNNPTVVKQRLPEPFPFSFEEIEEELKYIRMVHIYYTDVKSFEIKYLFDFIMNCF